MTRIPMMKTYLVALPGGALFKILGIPIPWILGPIVFVVIAKYCSSLESDTSPIAKSMAFVLLGIQIGLSFTAQTFALIVPYILPYTVLTILMIGFSLIAGLYISKFANIDKMTALVGSSPGGLSAMIAVSDALKGNSALVTIFHTLRLVSVLFIIPFFATHWVSSSSPDGGAGELINTEDGSLWTIPLYVIFALIGWKIRDIVPASLVIVPMLSIGILQSSGAPFYPLPEVLFILAQLIIGAYLGHTVSLREIILSGKTCLYFFILALFTIGLGIGLSFLLSWWTAMNLTTAVLSLAPGGLVEMSITAEQTGGEPAIVSSLQTIRLLIIVLILPFVFKNAYKR
ncbi:hypothetical protein SAMN05192559_104200 [Halobacillus karajensis]|uniref:AbrB family transcriptional regulator n=1 Tax=Halobacillus karajensis TaxID=195088 RepID=UPI0008A7CDC6|nr:AbrB family transcriptional regulator [Halobacillus karajensis]SEH80101.1 hypothetical protein SAMN05192559_104200 [Halobacillus karajensis]